MAKASKGEVVVTDFDYAQLEPAVADTTRAAAGRIRERMRKTVEGIIEIGTDLLAVREALPHGQFLPWLRSEFGWSERSAQNFMNVAERFESAKFADLPIQPSAAYLLAAPSVPGEAREKAVEKAASGQEITLAAAREIVAETRRKKKSRRRKAAPAERLAGRLMTALGRYRDRWDQKALADMARRLRDFADSLDSHGGRNPKKG